MSQDTPTTPDSASTDMNDLPEEKKRIYLVSYPKVVFMYPTMIAAFIAGIYMQFFSGGVEKYLVEGQQTGSAIMAILFLSVFAINMVVISFDFPRTTSLTLFFVLTALGLGGYLLAITFPNILPSLSGIIRSLQPVADATFYYIIGFLFVAIYGFVAMNSKFDYWEVRPNELLHHHGLLSDLERFSAPNLRIDKEINDLFEYMLLRSGRLILHPSQERRAIVLENVFFISSKEKDITRMLSALQVQVRTGND